MYSPMIESLIEQFCQFPGIGRKSAERMAFYVLDMMSESDCELFAKTVTEADSTSRMTSITTAYFFIGYTS